VIWDRAGLDARAAVHEDDEVVLKAVWQRVQPAVSAGQEAQVVGDGVTVQADDLLAHGLKQQRSAEGGADGVAVGVMVGEDDDAAGGLHERAERVEGIIKGWRV
jgi:hypothetical protein